MESNEKQSPDLSDVDSNEEIDDEELQNCIRSTTGGPL